MRDQRLADQERVGQAVGHVRHAHPPLQGGAEEDPPEITALAPVAEGRAGAVAPIAQAVRERVAVFLERGVAAVAAPLALRPCVADVAGNGRAGVIVVAGAAAVGQLESSRIRTAHGAVRDGVVMRHGKLGERFVEVVLLQVGEGHYEPAPLVPGPVVNGQGKLARPRRKRVVGVVVVVAGEAKLLEVVAALHPRGGLADLLDRGQQQADEDGDDGDHHQQLDQREA